MDNIILAILLLSLLVILAFGIALLCLSLGWKPQRGKSVFVSMIAVTMIALPILELFSIGLIWIASEQSAFDLIDIIGWFSLLLLIACSLAGMILLTIYAAVRRSETSGAGVELDSIHPSSRIHHPVVVAPMQAMHVLRKREWAFMIDIAPMIIVLAIFLLFVGWTSATGDRGNWQARQNREMLNLLVLMLCGLLMLVNFIYVLFKDGFSGVSFGKRVTGCRVVEQETGKPVSAGRSVLRNLTTACVPLAFVELAISSFRSDRRRIGDLLARTVVVSDEPDASRIDSSVHAVAMPAEPAKHPLDD